MIVMSKKHTRGGVLDVASTSFSVMTDHSQLIKVFFVTSVSSAVVPISLSSVVEAKIGSGGDKNQEGYVSVRKRQT